MAQNNSKLRIIPINNDAGPFVVIRLTTWAKYLEIDEDLSQNAGAKQGLQYNLLDPMANSADITANAEPPSPGYALSGVTPIGTPEITLGDKHNIHSGTDLPLGNPGGDQIVGTPAGTLTLGTPVVQVRTNSGNATNVVVKEWA